MRYVPYAFSLLLLAALWLLHVEAEAFLSILYSVKAVAGFMTFALAALFVGNRKKLYTENGYESEYTPYHLDALCRISDKKYAIPDVLISSAHATSLFLIGWNKLAVVYIVYTIFSAAVLFFLARAKGAILMECFD